MDISLVRQPLNLIYCNFIKNLNYLTKTKTYKEKTFNFTYYYSRLGENCKLFFQNFSFFFASLRFCPFSPSQGR